MINLKILIDVLFSNNFNCLVKSNRDAYILSAIRIGKNQDVQRVADMINDIRLMSIPNIKINYCYQVSYFHYLEVTIHYTIT